jgi:hypothetical protein
MPGISIKPGSPRLRRGHPLSKYLALGLVWPDAGAGIGRDASTRRNDATLTAGTAIAAGQTGRAINFTASSFGRADVGRQVITKNVFTISALIYPRAQGLTSTAGNGLFYQGSTGNGTQFGLGFFSAGQLFFGSAGGGNTPSSSTGLYALNAWSSVGVTFNAGAYAFVVNGKIVETGTYGASTITGGNSSIGYWNSTADPNRYFDGLMGHLFVWDGIALSAQQWAMHAADPYAMLRPRRRWAALVGAMSADYSGAGAANAVPWHLFHRRAA